MKTKTLPVSRTNDYLDMKSEGVKKKRNRIHYTALQIRAFEKLYVKNNFPDRETLEVVCEELDVSHKNAQVWFQNRRARSRRDPNDVSSPLKPPKFDGSDSNSPCSSPKPRPKLVPRPEFTPENLVNFVQKQKPMGNSKWHDQIKINETLPIIQSPEIVQQTYQPNIIHQLAYPNDYTSYQPINHDVPFYYQPIKTHDSLLPSSSSQCPISDILSETNSVTQNGYYAHSCYSSAGELGYYGNSECVTSQVRVIADANKTLTVL